MKSDRGKQILGFQANETKLLEEGEKEGGEEEKNPFERWYLEMKRRDNKDCVHRYRQQKTIEGTVPSRMVADTIPNISLNVHLIIK
jgi:hypothetical protein